MASQNTGTAGELTGFDRWMASHNGPDAISRILVGLAAALTIVGILTRIIPIIVVALVVLLVVVWRMLSTNVIKRRQEESDMLRHTGVLRPWLANPAAAREERRVYRHVKCPVCGQKARLPKGVGKVVVTCPGCGEQYVKKG